MSIKRPADRSPSPRHVEARTQDEQTPQDARRSRQADHSQERERSEERGRSRERSRSGSCESSESSESSVHTKSTELPDILLPDALPPRPADEQAEAQMRGATSNSEKAQWLLDSGRLEWLAHHLAAADSPIVLSVNTVEQANVLSRAAACAWSHRCKPVGVAIPVNAQSRPVTQALAGALAARPGLFNAIHLRVGEMPEALSCNADLLEGLKTLAAQRGDLKIGLNLTAADGEALARLDTLCARLPRCAQIDVTLLAPPASCWSALGRWAGAAEIGVVRLDVAFPGAADLQPLNDTLKAFKSMQSLELVLRGPNFMSLTPITETLAGLAHLTRLHLEGRAHPQTLPALLPRLARLDDLTVLTPVQVRGEPALVTFNAALVQLAPRLKKVRVTYPIDMAVFCAGFGPSTALEHVAIAPAIRDRQTLGQAFSDFKGNRSVSHFELLQTRCTVPAPWSWLTSDDIGPFAQIAQRNDMQFSTGGFEIGTWQKFSELAATPQGPFPQVPDEIAWKFMQHAGRHATLQLSATCTAIRASAVATGLVGSDQPHSYLDDTRLSLWDPGFAQLTREDARKQLAVIAASEKTAARYLDGLPVLLKCGLEPCFSQEGGGRTRTYELMVAIVKSPRLHDQALEVLANAGFSVEDQALLMREHLYADLFKPGYSPQMQEWLAHLVYMLHTGRAWPQVMPVPAGAKLQMVKTAVDSALTLSSLTPAKLAALAERLVWPEAIAWIVSEWMLGQCPNDGDVQEMLSTVAGMITPQVLEKMAGADNEVADIFENGLRMLRLLGHGARECARLAYWRVALEGREDDGRVKMEDSEVRKLLPDADTARRLLRELHKAHAPVEELARLYATALLLGLMAAGHLESRTEEVPAETRVDLLLQIMKLMEM